MIPKKDKPIIAIDIDDVLSESVKDIIKYSNEHWGLSLKFKDYNEHFGIMWKVDHIEAKRRLDEYINSGVIFKYDHLKYAFSVLNNLKKKYKLVIITSRQRSLKEGTISWINEHFHGLFNEEDINFAGIWDNVDNKDTATVTKADISKRLKVDYLIDDQIKYCIGAVEVGIKVLLFGDYPWNKSENLPKNISRVNDWLEVQRFFDGEK